MKPSQLLLSILLLLVSCTHLETTTHNATSRKSVIKEIPSKAEVFQYDFQADNESYHIDIHWIDSSTIEFHFVADRMPCVFEQKGIARKHPLLDTEIDEDPDGISVPYDEYFVKEQGELISILVSIENKNFVRIRYPRRNEADECEPYREMVMIRIGLKD